MSLSQSHFDFKVDDPREMLKLRARTVAARLSNHLLADKASAIDGLWRFAEAHGLVRVLGVDEVQRLLSEAFESC